MATYIQDLNIKLAFHPDGKKAQLFVPESLTKEFPALTPHVFVLSDKEFNGPYCRDIIEHRLSNFYKTEEEEVSNG
jgi:hypothetical protein